MIFTFEYLYDEDSDSFDDRVTNHFNEIGATIGCLDVETESYNYLLMSESFEDAQSHADDIDLTSYSIVQYDPTKEQLTDLVLMGEIEGLTVIKKWHFVYDDENEKLVDVTNMEPFV